MEERRTLTWFTTSADRVAHCGSFLAGAAGFSLCGKVFADCAASRGDTARCPACVKAAAAQQQPPR
jgi:hypothetical protein